MTANDSLKENTNVNKQMPTPQPPHQKDPVKPVESAPMCTLSERELQAEEGLVDQPPLQDTINPPCQTFSPRPNTQPLHAPRPPARRTLPVKWTWKWLSRTHVAFHFHCRVDHLNLRCRQLKALIKTTCHRISRMLESWITSHRQASSKWIWLTCIRSVIGRISGTKSKVCVLTRQSFAVNLSTLSVVNFCQQRPGARCFYMDPPALESQNLSDN